MNVYCTTCSKTHVEPIHQSIKVLDRFDAGTDNNGVYEMFAFQVVTESGAWAAEELAREFVEGEGQTVEHIKTPIRISPAVYALTVIGRIA